MSTSNSRDLLWKTQAPPHLREAWLKIDAAGATEAARAQACFAFAGHVMRYGVAVLDAASRAAGLPAPGQRTTLVDKRKPAFGDWSQALQALATQVAEAPNAPAKGLARGLVAEHAGSSSIAACRDLVQLRNGIAHGDEDDAIDLTRAPEQLPELRRLIRIIGAGFEGLRELPLCYLASSRRRSARTADGSLLRFVGEEALEHRVENANFGDLPDGALFLLIPAGALLLAPWLTAGERRGRPVITVQTVEQVRTAALPETALLPLSLPASTLAWLGRGPEAPAVRLPEGWTNLGLLGSGAMGDVWRAREGEGPDRALKVLRPELVDLQAFTERLRREWEAMRKLRHPNIPTVYALLEGPDHQLALVSEIVRGEPLSALLDRRALTRTSARRIADHLLSALQHAHDHGVIHRDVKPSNILVDEQGDAHLIDFGIARVEQQMRLTRTTDSLGTTAYAAPEQLQHGRADARADVYAAGRVLTDMLEAIEEPPDSPVRAVARLATESDPSRRWTAAKDMRQTLDPLWEDPARCPLIPGERVAGTYTVCAFGERLRPGIWQVAAEGESKEQWWLVIATREGDAEKALLGHIAGLDNNPTVRTRLGYTTRVRTDEGWLVALFRERLKVDPGRTLFPEPKAPKESPAGIDPGMAAAGAAAIGVAAVGAALAGGVFGLLGFAAKTAVKQKLKK
jgi:hypothetical protein